VCPLSTSANEFNFCLRVCICEFYSAKTFHTPSSPLAYPLFDAHDVWLGNTWPSPPAPDTHRETCATLAPMLGLSSHFRILAFGVVAPPVDCHCKAGPSTVHGCFCIEDSADWASLSLMIPGTSAYTFHSLNLRSYCWSTASFM